MRAASVMLFAMFALTPSASLRTSALVPRSRAAVGTAAATSRVTAASMLFELRAPMGGGLLPPLFSPGRQGPEVLYENGVPVDFHMQTLHLTKRRVSGGISVPAGPEATWAVLTAYESMPEVVPNILSNHVTRDAVSGRVTIQQESLLSNRMNLRTSMTLEAMEQRDAWTMALSRLSGHGFLEFRAEYRLTPRPDGTTYLAYEVELVPCPIFPLPLVERKIRKETPKMLMAVRAAAMAGARRNS